MKLLSDMLADEQNINLFVDINLQLFHIHAVISKNVCIYTQFISDHIAQ